MSVFLIIIIFFCIGLALQRYFEIPASVPALVNHAVINFAYPAAVLVGLSGASWDLSAAFPVLSYWLGVVVLWFVALLLKRRFNWSRNTQICVFLLTACGNTAFLGFPMVQAFFPQEAHQYALLYDQLGNFLAVSIVGPIAISLINTEGGKPNVPAIIKKVATFPPLVVLLASVLLPLAPLIEPVAPLLKLIAATIVPLTMTAIGLQFKVKIAKAHRAPVALALSIKMVALPIAVYSFGIALSTSPLVLHTTVFEAAMPPMVTAAVLLLAARVNNELVISILGIGTLLAFVTLPLLSQLLPV